MHTKRLGLKLFPLLLTIGLITLISWEASAKSFTIENVSITATIRPDGTVGIVEERTYRFDGEFSWANYEMPRNQFSRMDSILVKESGRVYRQNNSEDPRTYQVERSSGSINIRWNFEARDESRTFTIAYTLHGALDIGPEWSQLNWIFLSDRWDNDTRKFTCRIELPTLQNSSDLHAWMRGPLEQLQKSFTSLGVEVSGGPVDEDNQVIIRTVFPTGALNDPQVTHSDFSLAAAEKAEADYRQQQKEQARRDARQQQRGTWLTWLLVILSLGTYFYFYRLGGRRPELKQEVPKQLARIPDSTPPALVGYLVIQQPMGTPVSSTLFDLCRRGWYSIESHPDPKKKKKKKPVFHIKHGQRRDGLARDELQPWEKHLLDFVDQRIEDGVQRIDKLFKNDAKGIKASMKKNKELENWQKEWKRLLKEETRERQWFDPESKRIAIQSGITQAVLFVASILAVYWAPYPGIIALLVTGLAGVFSIAIYHKTREGEKVYRNWKAYRKALKKPGEQKWADRHDDRHFVYAVALSLNEKQLEKVLEVIPENMEKIEWIKAMAMEGEQASAAQIAALMAILGSNQSAAGAGAVGGAPGGAAGGAAGGGAGGGAG